MNTQDWTITGGMDEYNGDFTNLVEDYSGMVKSVRRSMGVYEAAPDGDVIKDYSPKPAKCGKLLKGQYAPDARPIRGRYMSRVMGQIMAQTGSPYILMTPDQQALQELALILAEWARKRTTRGSWYTYMQEPIEQDPEESAAVFVVTAQMYHEEWLQVIMEPEENEEWQKESRLAVLKSAIETAWKGLHITLGVQVRYASNTRIRQEVDTLDDEESPYDMEDTDSTLCVERMEAYDEAWHALEADVLVYLTKYERDTLLAYLEDAPDSEMLAKLGKQLKQRITLCKSYHVDENLTRLAWVASRSPIQFPWLDYTVA